MTHTDILILAIAYGLGGVQHLINPYIKGAMTKTFQRNNLSNLALWVIVFLSFLFWVIPAVFTLYVGYSSLVEEYSNQGVKADG